MRLPSGRFASSSAPQRHADGAEATLLGRSRSFLGGKKKSGSEKSRARMMFSRMRSSSTRTLVVVEEARDEEETPRTSAVHDYTAPPGLMTPNERGDDASFGHRDGDDDDECYLNSSNLFRDQSLHSLGPYERLFVERVMTKLRPLGYRGQDDLYYAAAAILRDVCAWEKPFRAGSSRRQPSVNADRLWSSIEQSLSRRGSPNEELLRDRPMAMALVKRSVFDVLGEMNVRVIRGSSGGARDTNRQHKDGSWGSPPFYLSYCQCSLF